MKRMPVLLLVSLVLAGVLALLVTFIIFIDPSIKLIGIENGKVYAKHPVIHLEKSFGFTQVTLNGKEIGPDYTVKENGSYIVKGESTLLWKKKSISYNFNVDDKPPIAPRIKEVIQKVYFKQAKFTLNKEENVTYKATLNGKVVPVDQPIQQPGENMLIITATKPNGLTATREIPFSIDNRTYPEKTINQFLDYYFREDVPLLYKFTGDVAINLSGDFNEEDRKMVEMAIKEMKAFFPYRMEMVNSLTNSGYKQCIKMVFTPTDNFRTYTVNRHDVWGVDMATLVDPVYGITESLVLIGTDKEITREYRNAVILHELLHAVGLVNHIQSPQSPLFPYANKTVTLGEKEKTYGELLYLEDVKPNGKKVEVIKELKQRIN